MEQVSVVGAGSWGTAIAYLLGCKGFRVNLWVYESDIAMEIAKTGINSVFLPGIQLPPNVHPTNSLEECLNLSTFIVWVTPSHTIRDVYSQALPYLRPNSILVCASKGIENETLMRVSEIFDDLTPKTLNLKYVTLSGPTFAKDVAMKQPTTAVVAGKTGEAARIAQNMFNTKRFRVYLNEDHIGVELGGALKNVIAIAVGIAAGLNLGSNTKAALITRGLWEIVRLGKAMNANPLTFLGLTGMGDLILTCDGTQSRNYRVGYQIGAGESLAEIQQKMRMVAEGVRTTKSVFELAKKFEVELPISEQVYNVLYHDKSPRLGLEELMSRSLKSEHQMEYISSDDGS